MQRKYINLCKKCGKLRWTPTSNQDRLVLVLSFIFFVPEIKLNMRHDHRKRKEDKGFKYRVCNVWDFGF